MAFRFSVLLQLSSCTYVYNYFSENARIKFIPIDADVSGVVMKVICYGLVDWLIRYPMTAVVTVVFTSCPTRGGQQRNQFRNQSKSCKVLPLRRVSNLSVVSLKPGTYDPVLRNNGSLLSNISERSTMIQPF